MSSEIKIRYTFRRHTDGKIWQEIVPIESLEGSGDVPFVLKYKDGLAMQEPEWEIYGRDILIGTDKDGKDIFINDAITAYVYDSWTTDWKEETGLIDALSAFPLNSQ